MLFGNTSSRQSLPLPPPRLPTPFGMFGTGKGKPRSLLLTGDTGNGPNPDGASAPQVGSAAPENIGGGVSMRGFSAASPQPGDGVAANLPQLPGGPLGGSMRQPFDYEKALAELRGEQPKIKDWQRVVAAIGDGLVAATGGTPWATRALADRQHDFEERSQKASEALWRFRHEDWARQNEADLRASDPFTIGRNRLMYDPASGKTQSLYHGNADFEDYAAARGLQPGTQDYFDAVEDYVLRSDGPAAYDRDIGLDDHRTANDLQLEGARQGNRVGLERMRQGNRLTLRQTPTYSDTHPRPARGRSSVPDTLPTVRTPAEAARLPRGTKFRTPDGQVKIVP